MDPAPSQSGGYQLYQLASLPLQRWANIAWDREKTQKLPCALTATQNPVRCQSQCCFQRHERMQTFVSMMVLVLAPGSEGWAIQTCVRVLTLTQPLPRTCASLLQGVTWGGIDNPIVDVPACSNLTIGLPIDRGVGRRQT